MFEFQCLFIYIKVLIFKQHTLHIYTNYILQNRLHSECHNFEFCSDRTL